MTDQPAPLTWDVYVTAPEPVVTDDLPPGAQQRLWSPIAATLISGERDAVLVDWVAAHGKNLTAVYVTHGHGDHWFGLRVILDRFPEARTPAPHPTGGTTGGTGTVAGLTGSRARAGIAMAGWGPARRWRRRPGRAAGPLSAGHRAARSPQERRR